MLFRPSPQQIFKRTRKARKNVFAVIHYRAHLADVLRERNMHHLFRCDRGLFMWIRHSCPMNVCDEPLRMSVLEAI